MMDFAGWEMPIYYSTVMDEHMAVRERAGLFDVSHMGELLISGPDAHSFVSHIQTNTFKPSRIGRLKYTFITDDRGRIKDDTVMGLVQDGIYLCVPNAATTHAIRDWFITRSGGFDVQIQDISERFCIALQGPASAEIMEDLCPDALDLEFFYMTKAEVAGCICWVSRSGYTGEDGFEIIGSPGDAVTVWEALMSNGSGVGLQPCGLGARDTLRIEKCFLLSGQDFHDDRTPLETTFDFAVKWDHDFIGKEALMEQRQRGDYDLWSAILLERRCIPRHGNKILVNGKEVASVTSGTLSPILRRGIALAFLPRDLAVIGTPLEVEIRSSVVRGKVVKKPFV